MDQYDTSNLNGTNAENTLKSFTSVLVVDLVSKLEDKEWRLEM